jgi:hypothetical protein
MDNTIQDFILVFISIVYEALPFVVIGSVIAGALEEFVPQSWLTRLVPRNLFVSLLACSLLGLIFPICECGIVIIIRRLLRKGLPISCCVAYMLAGPIINPVVILSTAVAFQAHTSETGVAITILRNVMGLVIAYSTALALHMIFLNRPTDFVIPTFLPTATVIDAENQTAPITPFWERYNRIAKTALHDFADILTFLIIGSLLAALTKIMITPAQIKDLAGQYPMYSILAMMVIAVGMCLCSEADAFVAASFTTLPPAALLSFLVLGPMFDLKLLVLFTRLFRSRAVMYIAGLLFLQVYIYSLLVYYCWPVS